MTAVRINLGAGNNPIEGYDNTWDDKQGKKAYPLALADMSVDELRASHILEHFSHHQTAAVVRDWARVLKPGGLMRLAVPDFARIAEMYLAGEPGEFQGWITGGQVSPLDAHHAILDRGTLTAVMRRAGLVGIHTWQGAGDCSELPISLNLAGYRRPVQWPKVVAVMSRPRLGFMDQFGCAMDALGPLNIPVMSRSGAYWGKCLTVALEAALEVKPEWILTLDYDTLFLREDIEDLLAFAVAGQFDALVPAQMTRVQGLNNPLLMNPKEGTTAITQADLDATYYPIKTGHFGCTLFRASALAKLPRPWFHTTYKDDGSYQYDDDINFWLAFERAGFKAALTPRVTVGHLECVAMWPDRNLRMIYQRTNDYRDHGKPRNVWR